MLEPLPPPPRWGVDELTKYIETAHRNRLATFVKKSGSMQALIRIDACFVKTAKGWTNPTDLITPMLLLRCHSAFRVACEHAMAGQVAEVFPLVRICLEYAAYALHIKNNPDLADIWLRRHDDEAAMKAVKNKFLIAKLVATIAKVDKHAADVFTSLYQNAIDFGAHPNERAITGSLVIKRENGKIEIQTKYLHDDDSAFDYVLKATTQSGVCALELLAGVFGPRFELLGIKSEILSLRRGL